MPPVGRRLAAVEMQLHQWWSTLTAEQQAYIIEHRGGELEKSYGDVVRQASRDPVSDGTHSYLVVLVSDDKTGRFRLPEMIRIYVEMKAVEDA